MLVLKPLSLQMNNLPELTIIRCPECGKSVNRIGTLYSLKGHVKRCSHAGKPIPEFIAQQIEEITEINDLSPAMEPEEPKEILEQCEIDRPFYPYQKRVYDWGEDKDKVGFFLEMRLGKTLVTIRWTKNKIKKNPAVKRILVLCPKTVIPVWLRELKAEGITAIYINPNASRQLNKLLMIADGWFVTNYECITATDLEELHWDVVILDESNKIKDPTTKITRKLTGTYPS